MHDCYGGWQVISPTNFLFANILGRFTKVLGQEKRGGWLV